MYYTIRMLPRLIAVSKGQSLEKIAAAYRAGQRDFGENYVQELLEKAGSLVGRKIEWHFLGHLQRNKVGKVLEVIHWLHSLDSWELAKVIDAKAETPLKCLLEIKLSPEKSKSGLAPKEALALIPKLSELSKIELKGLMTIPPHSENREDSRPYFRQLALLLKEINDRSLYKEPLTELSMGMSGDYEVAVEEGATMVRLGTAIFGERS